MSLLAQPSLFVTLILKEDIYTRIRTTTLVEVTVSNRLSIFSSPLTSCSEQQITLYPHRDDNNNWLLINATNDSFDYKKEPLQYIFTGARVKLRHVLTQMHLHSHDIRPPVSDVDFQNEVSGYGMPGFAGDANDEWIVEIETGHKKDKHSWKRVRTLRTRFRLRHLMTGCYLFSHKVKLPEWGYEQQEVTCNKNAVRENSLWYVETSQHSNCKS